MTDKNKNIIALDGGKKTKGKFDDDKAVLTLEGEEYELDSFVMSGQSSDGSRVLLTFNSSLDELISYTKVLDLVVDEKVKDALSE